MTFALLATSAIAPSLLLVWFFHARDAFPEPPRVLWTTFFLGMAIVPPVLLFAWPVYLMEQEIGVPLVHGLVAAFPGAAIPEELFKLLVLWRYSMRQSAFDEPMDGIVYGATASLGFATLENVLYVSGEGGSVAFIRAFTAVPGHAFLGAIMGYYVGRARFAAGRGERRRLMVKALAIPILLHGAYDFPLLAAEAVENPDSAAAAPVLALLALVPVVLCVEWIWALRLVRSGRRGQLAGGPPAVGVTPPVVVAARPQPAAVEPSPAAAVVKAPRPGRLSGWLLTLSGGLLASAGGLMLLGVALALVTDGLDGEEIGTVLLGTLIIGVLPAAAGAGLFLWGVVRLNRS
jgi:protease PrsW